MQTNENSSKNISCAKPSCPTNSNAELPRASPLTRPKGILKHNRKYDKPSKIRQNTTIQQRPLSERKGERDIDRDTLADELGFLNIESTIGKETRTVGETSVKSFVKDEIVERCPALVQNIHSNKENDSISTVHKMDGNEKKNDIVRNKASTAEGNLLPPTKVVRSLAELVTLAGKTSAMASTSSSDSNLECIEADVEFSCLPKEEYDDIVDEATSQGLSVDKYLELLDEDNSKQNPNNQGIFDDNDKGADLSHEEGDDDDGDDIFDFFADNVAEEDEKPAPPLRAFMLLWNAISGWITAEAVALLREYKNEIFTSKEAPLTLGSNLAPEGQSHMSDICASRCASLMNILKRNLMKSLDELGYSTIDEYTRRTAETRLGELIQRFDFTEPMVKFQSIQWRALTIILLNIVLPRHDLAYEGKTGIIVKDEESSELKLPNTLKEVGISLEEYKYLVDKAIPSLDHGS